MSPYPGSRLANLVVDENHERRKDVQRAFTKNRATLPGEELAVAVYNKLPEAAKGKKDRVEVVYKLIDQLYKSELRQGAKTAQEFRVRVKKFLKEERGKEWVNNWLQLDTSATGRSTSSPPVSITTAGGQRPHATITMLDQARLLGGASERNGATLPPPNAVHPGGGSTLMDPNVPRSSVVDFASGTAGVISRRWASERNGATLPPQNAMRPGGGSALVASMPGSSAVELLPRTFGVSSHRRRASDSLVLPCPRCGRYHGEVMPTLGPTINGGIDIMRVPRYDRGRGPVMNELMIVLRYMFIFSIAVLFLRYSESNLK